MNILTVRNFIFGLLLFTTIQAFADISLLEHGVKSYQGSKYAEAAQSFYQITNLKNINPESRNQAYYYLGLSLYKLKMYQFSSYPMSLVIKSNSKKYKQKSLEKLLAISNRLGNQDMLGIAISDMQLADLQKLSQEIYYYKLASLNYDRNEIDKAINNLQLALSKNPVYEAALNLLALSYLKKNEAQKAIATYQKLLSFYDKKSTLNNRKVYTTLNLARTYFQSKSYEKAEEYFIKIPAQSPAYRESLIELAWTYLNLGQHSKAIAALQNIHTPYFENFYDPESMFLRAILHKQNCQFDEAQSVIKSFHENYDFILDLINSWNTQPVNTGDTMAEIEYAAEVLRNENSNQKNYLNSIKNYNGKIPFKVTRTILKNPLMKSYFAEHQNLSKEFKLAQKNFFDSKFELRPFLDKYYTERLEAVRTKLVSNFNSTLKSTEKSMLFYKQQLFLVSYEIIDAQKNQLHKKTVFQNRNQSASEQLITSKGHSRGFYESQGYRYWPYQGELWKDEIGGFEYYGENLCE